MQRAVIIRPLNRLDPKGPKYPGKMSGRQLMCFCVSWLNSILDSGHKDPKEGPQSGWGERDNGMQIKHVIALSPGDTEDMLVSLIMFLHISQTAGSKWAWMRLWGQKPCFVGYEIFPGYDFNDFPPTPPPAQRTEFLCDRNSE